MKKRVLNSLAYSALVLANGSAWSNEIASEVSVRSIDGAGRNIMRTSNGGIVAAFSTMAGDQSALIFSRSLDNGASWNNIALKGVSGNVMQVAIDSNFQGSYIAFTENANGQIVGRIAYSSAPFGADAKLTISQSVTPKDVVAHDTFIQASRAGWGDLAAENRETVVYGWQDLNSKGLFIGVSPDGRTFPMARLAVADQFAVSGPAVAVRGNYVIATYQTTNSAMAPTDVPAATRNGRTYPAWVESLDGGQTWSKPQPLFGLTSAAFPTIGVETAEGALAMHRLAGGSNLPNSPILNWASSRDADTFFLGPDKTLPSDKLPNKKLENKKLENKEQRIEKPSKQKSSVDGLPLDSLKKTEADPSLGGTTFVQTSMTMSDSKGVPGEVSIVSFRAIEPGAKWTHVIANNPLTANTARVNGAVSRVDSHGSQFQYSALIDTAVRATSYQELDPATGQARLVAAVSTDTGKTFKLHKNFTSEELVTFGIVDFDKDSVFAASQCLFENRDGEVYIDLVFTKNGKLHFASLPIGVNAARLRIEQQAMFTPR